MASTSFMVIAAQLWMLPPLPLLAVPLAEAAELAEDAVLEEP